MTLRKFKEERVQQITVQDKEALSVIKIEDIGGRPFRERVFIVPPIPCPTVPDGTYIIEMFNEQYQMYAKGDGWEQYDGWVDCSELKAEYYKLKGNKTRVIFSLKQVEVKSAREVLQSFNPDYELTYENDVVTVKRIIESMEVYTKQQLEIYKASVVKEMKELQDESEPYYNNGVSDAIAIIEHPKPDSSEERRRLRNG